MINEILTRALRSIRGEINNALLLIDPEAESAACMLLNRAVATADKALDDVLAPIDQRERFEQAAYAHYLARHAAGKTDDSGSPPIERGGLLWRDERGEYGVLMFNAAWWAWQAAVKP